MLLGIVIGVLYGRNARAINERTLSDLKKMYWAFSKTKLAITLYYILENLYIAFEQRYVHKQPKEHNLLCECGHCKYRTVSIDTYVRRLKAAN